MKLLHIAQCSAIILTLSRVVIKNFTYLHRLQKPFTAYNMLTTNKHVRS